MSLKFTNSLKSFLIRHGSVAPEKPITLPNESRTEPIVAYRVWHINRSDGSPKLHSAAMEYFWPYRKALERDLIHDMGIHAVKERGEYLNELVRMYGADAMGEVYLWGNVTECERGYLAEFAYPKRIWIRDDYDIAWALELQEGYGVPVALTDRIHKADNAFGHGISAPTQIGNLTALNGWTSYRFVMGLGAAPAGLGNAGAGLAGSPGLGATNASAPSPSSGLYYDKNAIAALKASLWNTAGI